MLTSVWEGSDADLLEVMLGFYPSKPPADILDATYNEGRIWGKTARKITTMDIMPRCEVDYICDNQVMPGVPDAAFDVVVYDPPHVGAQGRDKSSKAFDRDMGATTVALKAEGYTLSFLYPGFLVQARRVTRPGGLVFAKITDQVNNHRARWAHLDFMRMAEETGFTVCDMIVKVRKGPMMSSKWQTMHHARKRHCFWIVLRNGPGCER